MRHCIRPIFLISVLVLLAGCNGASPAPPERIVLITLPGIGATEARDLASLQSLVQAADWAGRGVAASSHIVPAAASLFTGLSPWNHQVLHAGHSRLRNDLLTLAEALGELGYRSVGLSGNPWTSERRNYDQGFDHFEDFTPGVAKRLERSAGGREFFWVQLRTLSARGPHKELERKTLAELDSQLSSILRSIQTSDSWPDTLLIVTAEHGSSGLGPERGLTPLDRRAIEVPLVIRFPEGAHRSITTDPDRRVSLRRLWATIVESAGGQSVPAAAPSLYHNADETIVSELYRVQGANHFSLVSGDLQLLRRVAFLPDAIPRRRLQRQANVFEVTRPFTGLGRHSTSLLRWETDGNTSELGDEPRRAELDEILERRWRAFVDLERTPAAELALRPNGSGPHAAASRSRERPKQQGDH